MEVVLDEDQDEEGGDVVHPLDIPARWMPLVPNMQDSLEHALDVLVLEEGVLVVSPRHILDDSPDHSAIALIAILLRQLHLVPLHQVSILLALACQSLLL